MPILHLTRETVAKLPRTDDLIKDDGSERRQIIYWDDGKRNGAVRGLGLLCSRSAKTFVAQRNGGKRHTVGRWPDMSIKKAREIARVKLSEKPDRRDGEPVTLRQAMESYLDGMANRGCADRSIGELEMCITRYLEDWQDVPLANIARSEVRERHTRIGKRNGPYMANKVLRCLRSVYNDAMAEDDSLPDNPCVALRRRWFKESKRRETVADLADWYGKVMALSNPTRRAFFLFLLYTGLRSEDARTVRWTDVDWDTRTLHRPNPKGGEDKAFDVPLSRRAVAVLRYARAYNRRVYPGSPWAFPAASKSGHIQETKQQKQVNRKKVRHLPGPHVLRHTYVTVALGLGVPEYVVAVLVNHRPPKGSVTVEYAGEHDTFADRLRHEQERIAAELTARLSAA